MKKALLMRFGGGASVKVLFLGVDGLGLVSGVMKVEGLVANEEASKEVPRGLHLDPQTHFRFWGGFWQKEGIDNTRKQARGPLDSYGWWYKSCVTHTKEYTILPIVSGS